VLNENPETVAALAPPPARRRVPTRIWVLIGLAILFLATVLYVRHLQNKPRAPKDAFAGKDARDIPVAVVAATVAAGDISVRIPALGTVTPLATVTVRTQISGLLQKIAFTEGQLVQQGEFIAQIDPRPYQAALEQAKGNLRHDEALLADAKLDLTRYEALVKEDSIASQQLDTQRALVDQYEGSIQADQGAVATATVNLQYTHIVSPVTGRVGLRQVDQGNYVTPQDSNGIVVINQVQPITVLFSIPEDNVGPLLRRLHDGATLTVEAYDRTNAAKLADGRLLTLDNQIDTTTGTVKLRAIFENRDLALFPNQFVNVELLLDVLRHQLIIPTAAPHRGAPQGVVSDFVYVVKPDHTVAVRPVTLGVVDGDRVAVTSGLTAGESVVTEGGDRLRDGAAIELPAAAPTRAK
jgi:multidrug efflux system membrane fusion protein